MFLKAKSPARINITDPIAVALDPKNTLMTILRERFEGKCSREQVLITKILDIEIPEDPIMPVYQSGCSADVYMDVIYSYECLSFRPSTIIPACIIVKVTDKNAIVTSDYCSLTIPLPDEFKIQKGQVYPVKIRDGNSVKYQQGKPKVFAAGAIFTGLNVVDPIFIDYDGKDEKQFSEHLDRISELRKAYDEECSTAPADCEFFDNLLFPYGDKDSVDISGSVPFTEAVSKKFKGWITYIPNQAAVNMKASVETPTFNDIIDAKMALSAMMICYIDYLTTLLAFVKEYGPRREDMKTYWKYIESKKVKVIRIEDVEDN